MGIYSRVFDYFRPFLLVIISSILYYNRTNIRINIPNSQYRFLTFILFFLIIMNLIGNIPSVSRFHSIVFYLLVGYLILIYQNLIELRGRTVILWTAPICILYVVGVIRYGAAYGGTGFSYAIKSPLYLLINVFY